ncbi:MAG TPA: DUF6152 family protein [Bryobacteraceae bacterium]|nr:DUF6152 family protein [Bryobacteraceae bacterium]
MKLFVAFAALMLAAPGLMPAHHSFAAEYTSKLIVLNGTITRFAWMNPHTRIFLNVMDKSGKTTKWECEGSGPGGLMSNGWRRDSLKAGDHVMIECFPAKSGAHVCKARAVKPANGTRLIMGSTDGVG